MYIVEFYKVASRAWVKHTEHARWVEAKNEFDSLVKREWFTYSKARIVILDELYVADLKAPEVPDISTRAASVHEEALKQWPKIGSKIKFREASRWFWFTGMVKDAEELLEPGKEYTVASLALASSWCGVVLEEYPEHKFSLSWFEYPEELTTMEVKATEYEARTV